MTVRGDLMSDTPQTTADDLLPPEAGPSVDDEVAAMAVLDAATADVEYQQMPVSILCPGCGTVVTRFLDGLPERLARFNQSCSKCETELYRWCAVAIPTSLEEQPSATALEKAVTSYFSESIWEGITSTAEGYARNREFTRLYGEKAATFDWNWELHCPLCRRGLRDLSENWLDYHHWTRDPDQGICLCRDCHAALTDDNRDRDADWTALQRGLKNKDDLQIARLALREQAAHRHSSLTELSETLYDRYNVHLEPSSIRDIIEQVAADGLDGEIVDESLLAGLEQSND